PTFRWRPRLVVPGAAALAGCLLPARGGLAAAFGGPLPGPGAAAVAVHRLSHQPGPFSPTGASLGGAGAVGGADGVAVRGRHLARFSAHADAGHPRDVEGREGAMSFRRRDRFGSRLLPVCVLVLCPSPAAADGGSVRLSEQQGNYRISVFTAPTPVRAGPVDISVLVQDAATGEVVSGVRVTIKVARRDAPGAAVDQPATTAAATNKLFH